MSADHDSETETFEGDSGFETDPGATIMWFGIFKGTRLDELPDHYRWALVRFARERPCPIVSMTASPMTHLCPKGHTSQLINRVVERL